MTDFYLDTMAYLEGQRFKATLMKDNRVNKICLEMRAFLANAFDAYEEEIKKEEKEYIIKELNY